MMIELLVERMMTVIADLYVGVYVDADELAKQKNVDLTDVTRLGPMPWVSPTPVPSDADL